MNVRALMNRLERLDDDREVVVLVQAPGVYDVIGGDPDPLSGKVFLVIRERAPEGEKQPEPTDA